MDYSDYQGRLEVSSYSVIFMHLISTGMDQWLCT
jgi:hypothetical protein